MFNLNNLLEQFKDDWEYLITLMTDMILLNLF